MVFDYTDAIPINFVMGGFISTSLKEAIMSHITEHLALFLSSGDQATNREALIITDPG